MEYFTFDIFPKTEGAYLVGGIVRDYFLGRSAIDIDVVFRSNPESFAQQVASRLGGHLIKLGRPGQEVFKVVSSDRIIDICAMTGSSIEEDLKARDFTINALAFDLKRQRIVDPLDGKRDIIDKKVRMTSAQVFEKDPLRMLRAFRLAAVLGIQIEKDTLEAIESHGAMIDRCAGERIREELLKIFEIPRCHGYLSIMAQTELLSRTLLDPHDMRHGTYHLSGPRNQGGVARRPSDNLPADPRVLVNTLFELENIFEDCRVSDSEPFRRSVVSIFHRPILKLAALIHDMEPSQPRLDTKVGAKSPKAFREPSPPQENITRLRARLKLSNQQHDYLHRIFTNLPDLFSLFENFQNHMVEEREFTRLFIRCKELSPDLAIFALAANEAGASPNASDKAGFRGFIKHLLEMFFHNFEPRFEKPPLVTGHDLISEIGIPPSPKMGRLLSLLEEERLSGLITTRKEALDRIKNLLRK